MSVRAILLTAAAAGMATAAAAADWPHWLGPNRDGKSDDSGLLKTWPDGGPKLLWSVSKADVVGNGYGSPAVVGDFLYTFGSSSPKQDGKEFLACLKVADGSVVWHRSFDTTPGKYLDGWGGGPRATPSVDGDFVYVLGSTGDVACVAKADGKTVWKKNLVKDFGGAVPQWGYSESVVIDGDKALCTPGGKGGMVALDKRTGETIWQCKGFDDPAGYSSVVPTEVGGVRQYVQQTMKSGIGVRAADGKLLWQVGGLMRKIAVIPTPVVKDGYVFFTAGYGAGCELAKLEPDGAGGTKATLVYTKNRIVADHHGGVIEYNGKIYGHSDSKQWVCFDYLKGPDEPVWSSNKLDKGSITYADGAFYCYGEGKGTLVKIKATDEDWQELGRFTIPKTSATRPNQGKVWAHPVIANGRLYLRDYELLYCYDLRQLGA